MHIRETYTSQQTDSYQPKLMQLHKMLMKEWDELKVEDFYQQIVLNHLDHLPPEEVEYQISKEIKLTHQRQSFYFKLKNRLVHRQRSISLLGNMVSDSKKKSQQHQLPGICDQVSHLRDINLSVAQTLAQLHRNYGQKEDLLSAKQRQILMNLEEQNAFLKESFLNQYILFQQGYDPFFLYHYDMRDKATAPRTHPDIDRIFNLNLSYACRLWKAKRQILQVVSSGQTGEKFYHQSPQKDGIRLLPVTVSGKQKELGIGDGLEGRKKTSVHFRRKHLSLQSAKEKDLMGKRSYKKSPNASPMVNRMKTLNSSSYDSQLSDQRVLSPYRLTKYPKLSDSEQQFVLRKPVLQTPVILEELQELHKMAPVNFKIPKKGSRKLHSDFNEDGNPKRKITAPSQIQDQKPYKKQVKLQPLLDTRKHSIQNQHQLNSNHFRSRPLVSKSQRISVFDSSLTLKKQNNSELQGSSRSEESEDVEIKGSLPSKLIHKPDKVLDIQKAEEKSNLQNKKQMKMKPGKYAFSELMKYLKTLKIRQSIKQNTIMNAKWQQFISNSQCYIFQFLINGQLAVISICLKMSEGPYLIKLWGPLEQCEKQTSIYLFSKYIQYIQKQTTAQQIIYNGDQIDELKTMNFIKKKEKVYGRKRVKPANSIQRDYQPFLFLRCSNIAFPQQNLKVNILFSQQIEPFSNKTTYINNYVATIQKQGINESCLMMSKIIEQVKEMKALNSLLQDEGFDTYEMNFKLKISDITALRLALHTPFKSPFVAGDGYIKISGDEIYKTDTAVIYKAACLKDNTSLLFGKGFENCSSFIQFSRGEAKKKGYFSVKMFSKQLYGRLPAQGDTKGYYGNWQISLWWQDELQGRVKHPMTNCDCFGPDSFFMGVQIAGELVYAFQVRQDDLLM